MQIYQFDTWLKKNCALLSIWLCFYHLHVSNAQFHFGSPLTTERSKVPTPCKAPNGKESLCVPTDRCKQLNALITNLQKPISVDVGKYIKDSFVCHRKKKDRFNEEVCCPLEGVRTRFGGTEEIVNKCSVQGGDTGSCVIYSQCRPLLELLSNLRQPLPAEVPSLMQHSILCGREDVNGRSLPKVCCPDGALNLSEYERFAIHSNREALVATCPLVGGEKFHRIVGGEEALIGQYPWLALLGYMRGQNNEKMTWECGGSLIGEKYVLTAAHCINDKLLKVRVGEHTISNNGIDCFSMDRSNCNLGHQDFDIEKMVIHPEYNRKTIKNDIALIKITKPVLVNQFVRPICLPYDADARDDYQKITDEIHVAGWGVTGPRKGTFGSSFKGGPLADTLQHLNMTIFDRSNCEKLFQNSDYVLEDSQLCAGGDDGHDTCFGDSGSSMMTIYSENKKHLETWKLIGIVSFGTSGRKCGIEGHPGVYTRVRHYIPWILNNVEL